MANKSKEKLSPTILLCRLTQLKAQQKYLDATKPIFDAKHFQLSAEHDAIANIENTDQKLTNDFQNFCREKTNDIRSLTSVINEFSKTMISLDSVQKYKTNEYRDRAIAIDKHFCNQLQQNNETYLFLQEKYSDIDKELREIVSDPLIASEMTTKICPAFSIRATVKHSTKFPIDRSDNDAVRKFDEFLCAHKGYTGGWTDEEHNIFVKLKLKYKTNMMRIVECMQNLMPGKCFHFCLLIWVLVQIFIYITKLF